MTPLHRALLRANAVGMAAGHRNAAERGRITWAPDDYAAAYRAAGAVLCRLGFGHMFEGPACATRRPDPAVTEMLD